LQIALVDLLNSIGVKPAAVIGHSSGEISGAYAYGALSAAEAMRIAYFRGVCATRLAQKQERRGAMIAVGLSEPETRNYIEQVAKLHGSYGLEVACINSQRSTTVSGENFQVDTLKGLLDDNEIFARKLQIPLAYHSSHMLQIASEYRNLIGDLVPAAISEFSCDMISSVTGEKVSAGDLRSPDYWVQNLTSPVQFAKAFNQLCDDPRRVIRKKLDSSHRNHLGVNLFLEIGPHAALQGPIKDHLGDLPWGQDVKYYTALRRGEEAMKSFLNAVGPLYCLGCSVDLEKLGKLSGQKKARTLTGLPQYPFDHSKSYWRESHISKNFRLGGYEKLDLVGKLTPESNPMENKWRNHIRVSEMPWAEDHTIDGTVIYPAAGMLVMAIEAANQIASQHQTVTGFELKDVTFSHALTVPNTAQGVETTLTLHTSRDAVDSSDVWSEFRLCFFENDSWQESCHGFIRTEYETQDNEVDQYPHRLAECLRWDSMISQACDQDLEPDKLYKCMRECGFQFGPTFQTLHQGKYSLSNHAQSLVKVFQWPDDQYPQPHVIHPTTLDGILHVTLAAASRGGCERLPTAIPTSIRKIWVANDGLRSADNDVVKAMTSVNTIHNRGFDFSIYATDVSQTRVLVKVDSMQLSIVAENADPTESLGMKHICYQLVQLPDPDMSSSSQISHYCAKYRTDPDRRLYFEELNFTLFKFVTQILDSLGGVTPENVPSHIRKYIEWARLQCQNFAYGKLPLVRKEWSELIHDQEYFEAACRRIASASDQGDAFIRTGQSLLSILRGEIDSVEFFFKEDMMLKFYAEVNNRPCFDEWDTLLRTYAHKNPDMKVLEIGAGTGGTSRMILRTLCSGATGTMEKALYSSYDYTDISAAFFDKAREEFGKFGRINFEVLDIEKSPAEQGFEPHTYDLIIAANVLHATTNSHDTLQNIRTLLKNDGKLMMYEFTRPDILRSGFIFGLLPGWWAGEHDGRIWHPGLTSEQWNSSLRETGFSGVDLEFPDYVDAECQEGAILVSTAVKLKPAAPDTQPIENIYFIMDSASNQQLELYERIKSMILPQYAPNSVAIEACGLEKCPELPDLRTATLVFIQETEAPLISNMASKTFQNIQKVVGTCNKILFVTTGGGHSPKKPEYSLLDGWTRTLRNEKSSRSFVTLALDIINEFVTETQISSIIKVLTEVVLPSNPDGYEAEFVEIDGLLHIPRVRPNADLTEKLYQESLPLQESVRSISNSGPLKLVIGAPGLLDTLHWREDDEYVQPLREDEIEIRVKAVGMNFKDCLIALGRVPGTTFGQECAGVVTRAGNLSGYTPGDRVAGFGTAMFKTFVRCKANFTTKIPDSISFLEASGIPAQFGTAWQSVVEIGRLQPGESILIHAAAGGTGQAAVQIAQYIGAEIYATVGSKAKKQVLMDEYYIPEDHIFYSRDARFAQGLLTRTKGRGVDVIINSLAGEILRASWECIAPYGRFVEIGKKDILANNHLEMAQFGRNTSFTHFDGSVWIHEKPGAAKRCLEIVYRLFEEGKLHVQKPLQILNISEVEQAFRLMQSGTAAGKIVLNMANEAQVHTILPKEVFTLDPQATYLITGGLGGIGRTIARWMVTRGAKHLALLGRSGPKTEAAFSLIDELNAQGVTTVTPPCDLLDAESVRRVVQDISKSMPPIKGCIQGSMVLRDLMFHEMSYEDWRVTAECKGIGSWNLEVNLPRDMDFFVMLSSVCAVLGLPGQANYASGNSYLDGFAKFRVANSQKAVSLDLGAMAEEGLLVETEGFLDKVLDYGALNPVTRRQFLGILDYYCNPKAALLTPENSRIIYGIGDNIVDGRLGGIIRNNRMFSHLLARNNDDVPGQGDNVQVDFQKQFGAAQSLQEGRQIVSRALVYKFTHSYKIIDQDTEVNTQIPLHTLGVDSLLAVEICNWIKREFFADIAVFEVLGGATLSSVDVLVANRSHVKHPKWK
jgi:NADPH:quinone reductase-like Zn-dependent oxidoreductase/malonyl CoA-acyl carrier protein transacylase/NADP-dependent 3-hydroxy acid dehydrogenase YdfG